MACVLPAAERPWEVILDRYRELKVVMMGLPYDERVLPLPNFGDSETTPGAKVTTYFVF